MTLPAFRYCAFLSYSHRDRGWADWLHRSLETYRVPPRLVGRQTAAGVIPSRLVPIFRDRDELPSASDLSAKVNEALEQSAALIVICSPHAATSQWTNEEVLTFKRLGRENRIFCLIVAGEPNASQLPGREAEECFPPALRYRLDAAGTAGRVHTEPIAADVRPEGDGKTNACLKVIAGMLDVGFDELKQRELHRRTRHLTIVAAVAVGITLLTGALALEALLQRRAAERHQKQAEDLVGFMLGDLNGKLQQMQRLDVMEAIDDRAMAYFKSLPSSDVTQATLAQRARALEKIGGVRADQGHLQAALESYQAALQLAAVLAQAAPADAERQLSYANDWAWIGKTYWSLGNLDAAGRAFEAAQQVLARAEVRDPNDAQLRFETATLDNDIGHVLEAEGRLEDAERHYQSMLVVSHELVARNSPSKDWATELGMAHNNLGKLALMRGDIAGAISEYQADDAIETQLWSVNAKDNDQLENVVTARAILGRTLALAGDVQAGMLDLNQSIEFAARLVAFEPHNTTFQEDLALYQSQLARLKRITGELPAASALTSRSLASFATLTNSDPANAGWQREYAEAQTERAAESLAANDAQSAQAQSQAALALLKPLLARQPDERAILLAIVRARLQLAAVTPDPEESRDLRARSLADVESVKGGRADPRLLALEAEALLGLGRNGDAKIALRQLAQAGYRDPALMATLQRQHIDYVPQDSRREAAASARQGPQNQH